MTNLEYLRSLDSSIKFANYLCIYAPIKSLRPELSEWLRKQVNENAMFRKYVTTPAELELQNKILYNALQEMTDNVKYNEISERYKLLKDVDRKISIAGE